MTKEEMQAEIRKIKAQGNPFLNALLDATNFQKLINLHTKASDEPAPEKPIETLCVPIEETPKGLKHVTISKDEWEIVEESMTHWKFRKL